LMNDSKASSTLSCNWSSIPVIPNKIKLS
jgi:hypothetical protein